MGTDRQAGLRLAHHLMDEFARDTGLEGEAPPRRYLWTDAFAVCNFLGLHRQSGEGRELDRALRLVDQVHHVLGRHRPDDSRLAFREVGLAIGLHAIERIAASRAVDSGARGAIAPLLHHLGLAGRIDSFWSDPAHRVSGTWRAHRDINAVMLATSLAPEGHLGAV